MKRAFTSRPANNRSIVLIETDLKRSISTIRREIKRNLMQAGNDTAQHVQLFYRQRQRQKPTKCKLTAELWAKIEAICGLFGSPE